MTSSQLKTYGIPMDSWTDLKSFHSILFTNEASLYPAESNVFYFDSKNDLLYVRYIYPESAKYYIQALGAKIIKENNKTIYAFPGGHDSDIGLFHDVYDLDAISSIR